jgi:hypothetical protein
MIGTVVLMCVVGWLLLATITTSPPGPVRSLASGGMGLFIAWGGLSAFKRVHAYRLGWFEGRVALVRSLREATGRGMTASEWEQAEYERDMAALGWKPRPKERTEETE